MLENDWGKLLRELCYWYDEEQPWECTPEELQFRFSALLPLFIKRPRTGNISLHDPAK
jgi:hypothetical protein